METSLGTFSAAVEIGDPVATRFEPLRALVDTGASYTTLSVEMLRRLRVEASERRQFQLADDTIVERDVVMAQVRINGRAMPTLVVFEPVGTVALLGAYTLEGFGLGVDPVGRRLVPVRSLLMACTEVGQPMQAKRISNGGPTMGGIARLAGPGG